MFKNNEKSIYDVAKEILSPLKRSRHLMSVSYECEEKTFCI